ADYTGTSPDQRGQVVLCGDFRAKRVEIDPAAELTREALEPQLLAALENGMAQVRQAAAEKLTDLSGGMNLFGL
ncbi:MAG: YbaB/EbfC family nucleoid-associated protein, partial [Lentisphaeria bacterium]|nr:YbaB/EbfC family nucleoid-associated protein [Lentisphaeria bacterium]